MKRVLIVIVTIVSLVGTAVTAAHARRVPTRPDGDPDEVQSVKRHEEVSTGSRLACSQGRPARRPLQRTCSGRRRRLHIEVGFPGREFFLEK